MCILLFLFSLCVGVVCYSYILFVLYVLLSYLSQYCCFGFFNFFWFVLFCFVFVLFLFLFHVGVLFYVCLGFVLGCCFFVCCGCSVGVCVFLLVCGVGMYGCVLCSLSPANISWAFCVISTHRNNYYVNRPTHHLP